MDKIELVPWETSFLKKAWLPLRVPNPHGSLIPLIPNATELVKFTQIDSPILLFFKEGGSEGNLAFSKKAWFPLRVPKSPWSLVGPQFKSFGKEVRRKLFSKSFLWELSEWV
ncbi:MAG: hypothetical protein LWY06_20505 [Firmicutes bacterium]|nr:hypothetical protein [Bacillota bacterium]